jgi:hypothetical protein
MPKNVLLVEGNDDLFVTANLWKSQGLPEQHFFIRNMNGWDKLKDNDYVETQLDTPDLVNLGIAIDADTDLAKRWRELSTVLANFGYVCPTQPDKGGTILVQTDKPRVGIWLMPDNQLHGEIEDFLSYLVPDTANDSLWLLTEDCVNEAKLLNTKIPTAKARIHTYLAWKEQAGLPFGTAIAANYFDPTKLESVAYLNWLKALFPIP